MCSKKIKNFVILLILFSLTFSCTTKSLPEELEAWCNCEKIAVHHPEILDSCTNLMIDISKKYEFDPESVPVIQKKVKSCY